ncbi:phospholipid carrier-dependent glycosyltransferase [Candidatus Woesebacteria bacterium]|nr:phospholipid carrier-dependent glycosyltransferase [Candidatus Woesebacteria bacterium]
MRELFAQSKTVLVLAAIVCVAFAFRIYKLGTLPPSPLIDEVSFGYNAYSIAQTGRDEHGNFFPLVFEAFGDQKLPAYGYTMVPFVKLLGLNTFAVRLPSALIGVATVIALYFFLKELRCSEAVSLLGSLTLAVSPWSLTLSRFAYESNLGLLLFLVGLIFALKSLKHSWIWHVVLAGGWTPGSRVRRATCKNQRRYG